MYENGVYADILTPLVSIVGTVEGFISGRLMAAYQLDDRTVLHLSRVPTGARDRFEYVFEFDGQVIFEGDDFSTPAGETYGEAAHGLLGFLTLDEGDTDAEYFDGYTPEQLAWRDEYAEEYALYALDPED
jgi:hypothetical protein